MAETPTMGSVVSFRYKGGPLGDEEADDRSTGEPLRATLGGLAIPRGVERELMTMHKGERKRVEIPPELAYGTYQPKLADWHPRPTLPHGYELKVGDLLSYTNPDDGRRMPVFVTEATADAVKLDFNHPWAGKTVVYELELVDFE